MRVQKKKKYICIWDIFLLIGMSVVDVFLWGTKPTGITLVIGTSVVDVFLRGTKPIGITLVGVLCVYFLCCGLPICNVSLWSEKVEMVLYFDIIQLDKANLLLINSSSSIDTYHWWRQKHVCLLNASVIGLMAYFESVWFPARVRKFQHLVHQVQQQKAQLCM